MAVHGPGERTLLARHADVLVTMDDARREIPDGAIFARTGTGVAHCPCSNMRLGSGIAPVRRMRDAGVNVGLGVDGSASNDGGQMIAEARQALLLARLSGDAGALSARDALEIATRGGAAVLGRDDIGYLAPGMAADFVAFAVTDLIHAGAGHDPVAALVFCGAGDVSHSVIDGRVIVDGGALATLDLGPHIERHNRLARRLIEPA
jgi:8-oxoguanine deaminase